MQVNVSEDLGVREYKFLVKDMQLDCTFRCPSGSVSERDLFKVIEYLDKFFRTN